MFGLGLVEILVIVIVILVVIKPEKLPQFVKKIGKGYREMKKTLKDVNEMKEEFISLADQTVDDANTVKNEITKIAAPSGSSKTGVNKNIIAKTN